MAEEFASIFPPTLISVSTPWRDYQEETAEFFRSFGLDSSINISTAGIRATHDVDVSVRPHHAGFDVLWLVECKLWKTPISKLHVIALHEIVADTSAIRKIFAFRVWNSERRIGGVEPNQYAIDFAR